MRDPHDVVLGPIISERSVELSHGGRYQFRVAMDVNKIDIAAAVEAIYKSAKINVVAVNTSVVKGKRKNVARRTPGKKPDWKKATVKLAAGQRIEDFTV